LAVAVQAVITKLVPHEAHVAHWVLLDPAHADV
jgi:hypothetical protein